MSRHELLPPVQVITPLHLHCENFQAPNKKILKERETAKVTIPSYSMGPTSFRLRRPIIRDGQVPKWNKNSRTTYFRSSSRSPSLANLHTSPNPPRSIEPFIRIVIMPANIITICSRSVHITAFIPPYNKFCGCILCI